MLSLFYCRLTLPVRHNCPAKVQLYDFNRHKTDERKCQVAQKVPRWCKVSCYVSQKVLNCEKSARSFRNKMTIKERPFGSDLQQIYKSKKYKNGTRNLFRSSRNQHGLRVSISFYSNIQDEFLEFFTFDFLNLDFPINLYPLHFGNIQERHL